MKALALALVLSIAMPAAVAQASSGPAEAVQLRRYAVGARLEAKVDTKLRGAFIAKGSQVTVVKVVGRAGQTKAVDLELADGHVLRAVSARKVAQHFRPVR